MRVCVKEETDEFPSVPPGFESYPSFPLKRIKNKEGHDSDNITSCSASSSSEAQSVKMEPESGICSTTKITRSLRHRSCINYGRFDSSEDESDTRKRDQDLDRKLRLPKGVIRGCAECSGCQKVIARWCPEAACKPNLEDAPVFYPNEEEFEDTLRYINSIRSRAEQYGICRIVPPPSWKPPCPLQEKIVWESSMFSTRIQRVDKLQNRDSMRKMSKVHNQTRRKRRRCTKTAVECGTKSGSISGCNDAGIHEPERFGFEPGPSFTLDKFQKYADDFKAQYFRRNENITGAEGNTSMLPEHWEPSIEDIEGEYWRIVEKATEEIEVLYGADLETKDFGSGFPKMPCQASSPLDEKYTKSGWNLNNFPRLPGSVLSYESSDISGVLIPWLYIGMCFSSFCWHVEDHHLYSLNYMHLGAPKMWYGVPGKDAIKLEATMRKHLPELFEEQPDLLHKLVTQLSPSILKAEGVPVFRCIQNAGEFVLTFPRAYHAGFNHGFNCAEAVNVAPVDWLPHGQIAIELYREQGRRTSISHDKLLLGAAREAVRAHWELNLLKKNTVDNLRWKELCGKDGVLAIALKKRVEMERVWREFLCNPSKTLKMESNFDATSERECSLCLFDLHLSAAGCQCSPDKYACLNHAKQFCSCGWDAKFFLFRYEINELNILVEALEGKLSAVYRWARLDLGLALSSYISREKMYVGKLSLPPEERAESTANFLRDLQMKTISKDITTNSTTRNAKAPLTFHDSSRGTEMANHCSNSNKEELILPPSNFKNKVCHLSQEDTSYAVDLAAKECGVEKPLVVGYDNIILLSDDEDEEPKKPVSGKAEEKSSERHLELPQRLEQSDNSKGKDPSIPMSLTDATLMSRKDVSCRSDVGSNNCSRHFVQAKDEPEDVATVSGSDSTNSMTIVGVASVESGRNIQNSSNNQEMGDHNSATVGSYIKHLHPHGDEKPNNGDKHEKVGATTISDFVGSVRINTGSPSCSQNNPDRCFRQKGPRIAKVVRRINCNVEPLEFGSVLSGKSWCNSLAIFPKGFRSRVKYINVLDPTSMCYYVSEILDAGRNDPLFMVSVEHCPSEVFIHVSTSRCWEMVRERVNQEITKQHKLGRTNLPPLQPPGSLDGFEMFGFSSPTIVQAIEALDRNRVCIEYWDSRPYSRYQVLQHIHTKESLINQTSGEHNNVQSPGSHSSAVGVNTILEGFFKKANPKELRALHSILSDSSSTADRGLIMHLLSDEIQSRPI